MEKLIDIIKSLNFYKLGLISFLIFITFLDTGSLVKQFVEWRKLQAIKEEKLDFEQKTRALEKERKEIFGTKESTESFAREKYLMKKPTETVFIIVDKNNQSIEK